MGACPAGLARGLQKESIPSSCPMSILFPEDRAPVVSLSRPYSLVCLAVTRSREPKRHAPPSHPFPPLNVTLSWNRHRQFFLCVVFFLLCIRRKKKLIAFPPTGSSSCFKKSKQTTTVPTVTANRPVELPVVS